MVFNGIENWICLKIKEIEERRKERKSRKKNENEKIKVEED